MEKRQLTALATKAIEGDKEAFEELYLEHARSILFHVRSLIVDKDNCYDVAQDAIYKMYMNISKLREPAAFRGWMHQVIRTVCADHNKSIRDAAQHMSAGDNEQMLEQTLDEGEGTDPEAAALATLEGNQLFAIVNELPENYREIIVQRYYDDLSYKEIAEIQQISVSNVSTRLQRATEAIRKKMGELSENAFASEKSTAMEDKDSNEQAIEDTAEDVNINGTSLKSALAGGMVALFPDDSLVKFAATTHDKVFSVGAAAATTASAATAATLSLGSKVMIAIVSVLVVITITVTTVVVTTSANNDASNAANQALTVDYAGQAHVSFIDENGGGSDRNVVRVMLVEDVIAAQTIEWKLYRLANGNDDGDAEVTVGDEGAENGENTEEAEGAESTGNAVSAVSTATEAGATEIASGTGNELDSTVLAGLEQGHYLVVFTLVDENQAKGEARRSFNIEG